MGELTRRLTVLASALLLTACTSTMGGAAVKAPESADSDGAIVALLDTGNYPTTAGPPVGTAGSLLAGEVLEAHRIAEDVAGPWQVDEKLIRWEPTTVRPLADDRSLSLLLGDPLNFVLDEQLPGIAVAHGFIAGFSSGRTAKGSDPAKALINAVLRFPDPAAAAAAATEMAAKDLGSGATPRRPLAIHGHPEATASVFDNADGAVVRSFAAHGPYVLYQFAEAADTDSSAAEDSSMSLTEVALNVQERLIDQFVPTDPAKLTELPRDPTGQLRARVLPSPGNIGGGAAVGAWGPAAWWHYEHDPIKSAAIFRVAGLQAVALELTTVYQTHNSAGAAQVADEIAAETGATADIKAIAGVRGLPSAKCFARPMGWKPITNGSLGREAWHFKCVSRADKYAFVAYSDDEKDVKQQTAAQYRILAGK